MSNPESPPPPSAPAAPPPPRSESESAAEPSTTLPPRHGVLLTVAYDGTAFHGWAIQKGQRTVAEAVQAAIHAVDARASLARGTSRTDSGVHAEGQMVAFDAALDIAPRSWVLALNQHLPDDVAVRRARRIPVGYNPRFASEKKRYRYRVLLDPVRDPLWRGRAWRIGGALDLEAMEREARGLVGTHDFRAFRSAGDGRDNTVRTLTRVALEHEGGLWQGNGEGNGGENEHGGRVVGIVVEGTAFLYNMVRIIAGTLVEAGLGRRPAGCVARALETGDRGLLGTTAPAQGLTLERIHLTLPDGASEPWPA